MLFLTKEEAVPHLSSFTPFGSRICDGQISKKDFPCLLELGDEAARYYFLAGLVTDWLSPYSAAVLLVTEFGIVPSRENLHLVQRLRAAYSEKRPLFLAPGHLLMGFEASDLTTLLHVSLLHSWGGAVASNDGKTAVFSHDGWIGFVGPDCDRVRKAWAG